MSRAACSACSASARAASLASQRASRERATSRFSGSTGAEGPLGPVGVVAGALDGELGGPAGPLVPARDLAGGRQRQGDLAGGERVQQRARDGGVHAGRGDRPARWCGQLVPARAAVIGWPLIGVVVGHHRLAAAAAADDSLAQRGALPRRPGTGGGVVGRQPGLAGQVVRPGDVALVVVFDQHRPFGAGPFGNRGVHRARRVDGAAGGVAAEHVRPGVARVLQDPQYPGVGEPPPAQLPGPRAAVGAQREPAAPERGDHPVGRPARGERGEHVTDRGLDLGVGVDHDIAGVVVDIADRQRGPELAALGCGPLVGLQPLRHHVQFHFSHGALEAQEHAVVHVGGVVDPVRVDQQRAGDPGEFRQPRHVGVGPGQPGDLDPEDRPDIAPAHPGDQLGESLPGHPPLAGDPQVGIDHLDQGARPAQPGRRLGQAVLAPGRLGVLPDLGHRGLPQVDQRRPIPVTARDLVLAVHACLPAPRWSCWPVPPLPRPARARTGRRHSPARTVLAGPAARR